MIWQRGSEKGQVRSLGVEEGFELGLENGENVGIQKKEIRVVLYMGNSYEGRWKFESIVCVLDLKLQDVDSSFMFRVRVL